MPTFAGKYLRSYPDQICGGRTKSASIICPPGPNLLALSVPPDQIRGRTDFTVTPAKVDIYLPSSDRTIPILGHISQKLQKLWF